MVPLRSRLLVLVFATLTLAGVITPAASAATNPWCGITWGSLPKADRTSASTSNQVTGLRTGQHACFDRLVLDLGAPADPKVGYLVRYVDQMLQFGTGWPVSLRGAADLEVIALAPAYDHRTGRSTYDPAVPSEAADVTGYRTFRQVALTGSFEGQTQVGVGVRARLPFRIFILDGPGNGSRMVIDVAHRW